MARKSGLHILWKVISTELTSDRRQDMPPPVCSSACLYSHRLWYSFCLLSMTCHVPRTALLELKSRDSPHIDRSQFCDPHRTEAKSAVCQMVVEEAGRRIGALAVTMQEQANFTMEASSSIVRPEGMPHHLQWVRARILGVVKKGDRAD